MCTTDLLKTNKTEVLINSLLPRLLLLLTHKAAFLDFEMGFVEVPSSFQVKNHTLGGVPDGVSDKKTCRRRLK